METKKIYPCVRCAESTFKRKIAPKLRKLGYRLVNISDDFHTYGLVAICYNGDDRQVSNFPDVGAEVRVRHLCATIPEFIAAAKALAIEQGWFKEEAEQVEEMKWGKECPISELPPRLRRLAEYRKNTTNHNCAWCDAHGSVNYFIWENTPEGHSFWKSVYNGVTPANLEAVLDKFEKAHPELLDEPKQEAISEKETTTETVEEKQPEPSTPTLSEARRQFCELTKHYTVEQLSTPELPRSWEEYLEQNLIADTTELDKKLAALRKLVLLRDEWRNGWTPEEGMQCWGVKSTYEGVRVWAYGVSYTCLSFPAPKMAENFLNTFRDLIEEAGDLI